MAEARDAYIKAMFELSKADPAKWATFVETFKTYTWYEMERMLGSNSPEMLISVGQSRRMRELRDDFINIEQIAEKVRKAYG